MAAAAGVLLLALGGIVAVALHDLVGAALMLLGLGSVFYWAYLDGLLAAARRWRKRA